MIQKYVCRYQHINIYFLFCTGILEHSMGARNRVGLGLSYQSARLHRLAESIPWNQFLGSFQDLKYRLWRVHGSWVFSKCLCYASARKCYKIYSSLLFCPRMALASLFAISGPKKVSIHGPPLPMALVNGYCPHKNPSVLRHINDRYINSYKKMAQIDDNTVPRFKIDNLWTMGDPNPHSVPSRFNTWFLLRSLPPWRVLRLAFDSHSLLTPCFLGLCIKVLKIPPLLA